MSIDTINDKMFKDKKSVFFKHNDKIVNKYKNFFYSIKQSKYKDMNICFGLIFNGRKIKNLKESLKKNIKNRVEMIENHDSLILIKFKNNEMIKSGIYDKNDLNYSDIVNMIEG